MIDTHQSLKLTDTHSLALKATAHSLWREPHTQAALNLSFKLSLQLLSHLLTLLHPDANSLTLTLSHSH